MNRTTGFLALAVGLLLVAAVLGLPNLTHAPPPAPTPPTPVAEPMPPPKPVEPAQKPGSLSLTGRLSHPYLAQGTSDVYASLEVSAVDVPGAKRTPVNLAVVIDRSGSMSGAKIENARRAANHLVDLLGDDDQLSIVHYGTDVDVLPARLATAENKARMHRFINAIEDNGGTNIGDGLAVGAKQIATHLAEYRVNRLLLLSDGQPTVGITSSTGLVDTVRHIRDRGISVTSLGVGADFNEDLMQRLADVGGGSYGFISNASAMATLFEKDLEQAGTMVARTVNLTFQVPAGVQFVEVYGRPVSRVGDTVSVALPDFSARQVERLVVHFTATPSVRSGSLDVAAFTLGYTDLLSDHAADARLSLSAMVPADTRLVMETRDKDAVAASTRARPSVNYQKAAQLLEAGDSAGAEKVVKANDVLFDDAEGFIGGGALSDERKTNAAIYGLSSAPAAARPEAVKQMKTTSLKAAGRGTSVY